MNENKTFHFDEVDLLGIVSDILRNIWLPVLIAISAYCGVLGFYKLTYQPEYTSNAILVVNSKDAVNTYSSLTVSSQMAGVFSEVFQSDVLRKEIADELSVSVAELDGSVSATLIENTNLISVNSVASTPKQAYQLIAAALERYTIVTDYLFSNATIRILREPLIPYAPSNPYSPKRVQLIAMAIGVVMICAIIAVFSMFRYTVRTEKSAERNLDGKTIGIIPFAFRKRTIIRRGKMAPLIGAPFTTTYFVEAIQKTSTRLEYHCKKYGSKVILFSSILENEGKSSISINVACSLARRNKRVIVIDMDFRKPALHKILEAKNHGKNPLSDYLSGKCELKDCIYTYKKENIDVIFQNSKSSGISKMIHGERFLALKELLAKDYDYIIIDSAPVGLTSDTEALAPIVDSSVIVVRYDRADIRAINDAVDLFKRCKVEVAGFVLNGFRSAKTKYYNYGSYYYKSYHKHPKKEESSDKGGHEHGEN